MGSKGSELFSMLPLPPSPSSQSVVCCMCGDYGLVKELFRCKVCFTRSQHKYCSDLYPKAETYRACNWCLREEGGKPAVTITEHSNQLTGGDDDDNKSNTNGGSAVALGVKLQRRAFPLHLSKPVKKQKPVLERSVSDVIHRVRSEELSPGSGKGRPMLRSKVRRYKLLEEVSS